MQLLNKKIVIFTFYFLLFTFSFTYANEDAGLPGNYLYSFSANARALGMGRAYTAIAFDSSAPYWNPAGLAKLVYTEGTFLFAPLFEDTVYYFLGIGYPLSYGSVLGISSGGLEVGGIENTVYDREFEDKQNAYIFSYARSFSNLDLGINLKIVHHRMDIYSDSGFGIDIGGLYEYKEILLGASIQNIFPPHLKLKNKTDKFPVNLKIGTGYKLFNEKIIGAFDLNFINLFGEKSHPVRWHLGGEYSPYKFFSLRMGLDYKEKTFGFGFNTSEFSLDYAFGAHSLGVTHRFSFSSRFGLLPTEAEKLINEKKRESDIILHYAYGLEAFNQKNFIQANKEIKKALKLMPAHEQARKLLNKVRIAELYEEAKEAYILALEERRIGNDGLADELIRGAKILDREVEGKLEEEFFFNAHASLRIKEYKKAKEELENVLQINPDNTEARILLKRVQTILEYIE